MPAQNQRRERTTLGHALLILRGRECRPIRLPDPPGEIGDPQSTLEAIATRFSER